MLHEMTAVFFKSGKEPFYRKAVVATEEVDWFLKKGALTADQFNQWLMEKEGTDTKDAKTSDK